MSFIIPNQTTKQIRQLNKGDLVGELFITKNIDLRDYGKIKLSHATIATMTTDNDAAFSTADMMFPGKTTFYINSTELFDSTTLNVALDAFVSRTDAGDTNPPTPGVEDYGIYFNDTEVVSDGTALVYRSAATTWTDIATVTLVSSYQTSMAVFDTFNSLLVANQNKVLMIDTSWVTTRTLTIPSAYTINSIAVNNNLCYIGTRHIANGEAKMFTWDGTSTAWSSSYGVSTFEIFSIKKYKGSVALITSKGKLLQFNGAGFTELAQLPVTFIDSLWGDATSNNTSVSSAGMVVDDEKIYIRLNEKLPLINYYDSYFIGGTWCYTPDNGLYCMYTPTYTTVLKKTVATSAVDISTNIITSTSIPITGTPVIYFADGSTVLGGLTDFKLFYTIKISSTEFKVATSLANALAGTAIDLTGTGNNAQSFYFLLVNDYGWSKANHRGAVDVITNALATNNLLADRFVFTADLASKTSLGTKKTVFNVVNPQLNNSGYFITPKLNSSKLEDIYNTVSIKYKPLKEEDSIIIKYRTKDRLGMPFNSIQNSTAIVGTWTDTNTFTTTLDMSDVLVGDEIEIIAGVGAGFLSHVQSLSVNAGTWTINLTDSFMFAVANDVMYFSVDNWTYLQTITAENQTGIGYSEIALDNNSKFLQLKIELKGVDTTIEELRIDNNKFLDKR